MGGFTGADEQFFAPQPTPDRAPDRTVELFVPQQQAMLYRLNGDYNPLHADPAVATAVGFPGPILHGLCTFGHAGRAVLQAYGDNDPARFKAMKVHRRSKRAITLLRASVHA
jgi:acyl dehydratase